MRPAVALQYLTPHRFLSRLVRWGTRWTWKPWKNFLIRTVVRNYNVDLTEAETADFAAYASFNAFFTRALKANARPLDPEPEAILSPADGRVSQAGAIDHGRIFQAKGFDFGTGELLGDDARAAPFHDGSFATIYLSPRDYHRVHMPIAGELVETVHVPGRIFSVAPFAVVLVGAMLVSGVATVWDGVAIPPYASSIVRKNWRGRGIWLRRGAEMGRFEMGSTVIVLLPSKLGRVSTQLAPNQVVKMGQKIGTMNERASR
jgi:phosphatidylserine decarboxylase